MHGDITFPCIYTPGPMVLEKQMSETFLTGIYLTLTLMIHVPVALKQYFQMQ